MMTYEEFVSNLYTKVLPAKDSNLRVGQALMNYLSEVNNVEYKRIASIHYYDRTDIDCYYKDELIPNTLEHLKINWNE